MKAVPSLERPVAQDHCRPFDDGPLCRSDFFLASTLYNSIVFNYMQNLLVVRNLEYKKGHDIGCVVVNEMDARV